MKLVMFSSPEITETKALFDALLVNGNTPVKSIGYIPSWYSNDSSVAKDFKDFSNQLPRGVSTKIIPIDLKLSTTQKQDINNFDALFIDGGNTFLLLNSIKKNRLTTSLKNFSKNKVLAGVSAGGIIMTPTIGTAEVPSFSADDNFVKQKDYSALNLVNFEFSPHYEGKNKEKKELQDYANMSKKKIMACDDGSGLIVINSKIQIVGSCQEFIPQKGYTKC